MRFSRSGGGSRAGFGSGGSGGGGDLEMVLCCCFFFPGGSGSLGAYFCFEEKVGFGKGNTGKVAFVWCFVGHLYFKVMCFF